MNKTVTTAAIAVALGLVWIAAPAMAQQSTTEKAKDKAESAKDSVVDKTRDAKDAVVDKSRDVKDKVMEKTTGKSKAERTAEKAEKKMEKAADKADSTLDRAKDKAVDMKDKVADKMHRANAKSDVTAMQRALAEKGHNPGPIDGRMGPRTRAALRDYQKKEGLNPTGRWDAETGAKLGVQMSATTPADTMRPTSPSASPSMPSTQSTPPGVSTQPPAVPEDKTAPPAKRNSP